MDTDFPFLVRAGGRDLWNSSVVADDVKMCRREETLCVNVRLDSCGSMSARVTHGIKHRGQRAFGVERMLAGEANQLRSTLYPRVWSLHVLE